MDIIKNPIVVGLIASVITYIYLSWRASENNKKKKSKDKKKEEVNLLIPLIVGVIVWFVMYGYLEYKSTNLETHNPSNTNYQQIVQPLPLAPDAKFRFAKDVMPSSTSEPKSFSILTGGVSVPTKALPDVMLDLF